MFKLRFIGCSGPNHCALYLYRTTSLDLGNTSILWLCACVTVKRVWRVSTVMSVPCNYSKMFLEFLFLISLYIVLNLPFITVKFKIKTRPCTVQNDVRSFIVLLFCKILQWTLSQFQLLCVVLFAELVNFEVKLNEAA